MQASDSEGGFLRSASAPVSSARAETGYSIRNVGLRRMTVRRGLRLRTSVIVIR